MCLHRDGWGRDSWGKDEFPLLDRAVLLCSRVGSLAEYGRTEFHLFELGKSCLC